MSETSIEQKAAYSKQQSEDTGLVQNAEPPANYSATADTKTPLDSASPTLDTARPTRDPVILDDALQKVSVGCGTLLYVAGPIFISFFEGAELVVISVISLMMKCSWNLDANETFLMSMCPVIGMFLGSAFCSSLSDRYGRRKVLIWQSIGLLVAGTLTGLSGGLVMYLVCQALVGVCLGAALAPLVALMVEVVPIRWRVVMLAARSAAKGGGTVFAALISWWLHQISDWRVILIVISMIAVPAIVFLCMAGESPRYSMLTGKEEAAIETLARIERLNQRCGNCLPSNEDEIEMESRDSPRIRRPSQVADMLLPVNEMDLTKRLKNGNGVAGSQENSSIDGSNLNEEEVDHVSQASDVTGISSSVVTGTQALSLSRAGSTMSDLVEDEPDSYNLMRYIRNNNLTYDLFFIGLYGFSVQALYYAYISFAARIIKDGICDDYRVSSYVYEKIESTDCGPTTPELFELTITYLVSPVGAFLAAMSAEWLGRRPTGYIIATLLTLLTIYFYACSSEIVTDFILGFVAILKCGSDLLPYLVASEYFPTAIRGFGVSMAVTGAKFGASLSVLLGQYVYNLSPIYIVIYIHLLCFCIFVSVFFLKKETRGLKLTDI